MSSVASGLPIIRVPIIVPLTTLVLADEIARVEIMQACSVEATSGMISGALRLLSGGTFTVLVKNDAAATVATLSWSAAGLQNATDQESVATVAAGLQNATPVATNFA